MKERIEKDLTKAVKNKEELKSSVLRLLLAAVRNKEKEKRYKSGKREEARLSEEEIREVVAAEAKKRKEALAAYQKSGRLDLAEKEKKELEILQEYLPPQLSEQEIKQLAKRAIRKTEATGPQDMGKVMAQLMPQIKGRADGQLVAAIVKELLTNSKSS